MKYDYYIAIFGAGSAGLSVASSASALGAKVALIENRIMGGDCLNFGCVPSKTFLKSCHIAKNIKDSNKFGIDSKDFRVDIEKIMGRVKNIINEIAPHDSEERYKSLGVDVYRDNARIISKNTIQINGKIITSKYIVIATGSGPMVPNIPGLKDLNYLTNENIFDIKELPKKLIVLGAGPIGLELGQAFKRLGSDVTIIDMLPKLFSKDEREVSDVLTKTLETDGIEFFLSSKILEVKVKDSLKTIVIEKDGKNIEVTGDEILVSLGRVPNSKNMGLDNIDVKINQRGYVVVDKRLRTNIKNIYACGDVVGPYQFTHMANYQAGIIIRNIIFKIPSKVNYSKVSWVTYTSPEVAHVGLSEEIAKNKKIFKESIMVNINEIDRSLAEDDRAGFLKLILNKRSIVIGATIVSEKAGELLSFALLAINKKVKVSEFANIIFPYPTQSEIYKFAAYKYLKGTLTDFKRKLIKIIFLSFP